MNCQLIEKASRSPANHSCQAEAPHGRFNLWLEILPEIFAAPAPLCAPRPSSESRLAHRLATAWALGACRFDSVTIPLARGLPTWQSMLMPDYSLFGDEHVRQYEATGGKIGHDWNNTCCLVLHTIGRK